MGVERIISGGQRGADVAGLDAALELGIPIGGHLLKGRVQFATYTLPIEPYVGMEATDSDNPSDRTRLNIRHSDGTIIFSHGPLSHGSAATECLAWQERKPCLHVDFNKCSKDEAVTLIRAWLARHNLRVLNIAGPPNEPEPDEARHNSGIAPSTTTGRTLEPGEADQEIYKKVKHTLIQVLLPQKLSENPVETAVSLRNEALYQFRQWDTIRWQVPYWFVTLAAAVVVVLNLKDDVSPIVRFFVVLSVALFAAISCRLLWNTMRYHDRLIEKVNADINQLLVGEQLRKMFRIDLGFSFQWPWLEDKLLPWFKRNLKIMPTDGELPPIMRTSAFWMVLFVGLVGTVGVPVAAYAEEMTVQLSHLLAAYIFNILILIPVGLLTLLGSEAGSRLVFQGKFPESTGTRTILGSLWTAILVASCLGLFYPVPMSPVLIVQIVYKSLWLLVFVLPRLILGRGREVPWVVAVMFLVIVLAYPWIVPWGQLFAAGQ
jgi:hypothetical protein